MRSDEPRGVSSCFVPRARYDPRVSERKRPGHAPWSGSVFSGSETEAISELYE